MLFAIPELQYLCTIKTLHKTSVVLSVLLYSVLKLRVTYFNLNGNTVQAFSMLNCRKTGIR